MNRQHSNRGGANDDYPSDELNDARSDAGLPDTYNDEEPSVTVDELAKLLHEAELKTQRPTSAMSNHYVNTVPRRSNNDILGDIDKYNPEGRPGVGCPLVPKFKKIDFPGLFLLGNHDKKVSNSFGPYTIFLYSACNRI
uniref:Uncharacterized protein n=1 Tax=Trichogramma kaykai TaxID=54128 RepID=A0ABD2W1X3_9HYME